MEILREYTVGRLQEGADETQPALAPQNDEIHWPSEGLITNQGY